MPTPHDAYGKILEEVDEFFDEVKQKDAVRDTPSGRARMLQELVQVGAMAQRAAEDLKLI
jgi:NTP pyrophosphatase (non-canonical NTP hydrolase)